MKRKKEALVEEELPLHTKYRPRSFDEILGNKQVIKSLKSLIKNGKSSPHVFLFSGPSGCGKTTLARIIAKELNCSPEFDIQEVDIGNNRGIDTAREVLKTMHLSPMGGDNKIVIFDEVHSSTKDFQGALLKALEDSPSHTYFVLCTTNPQKLLPTIRNRCTSYEVKKLKDKRMEELIKGICIKQFSNSFYIGEKVIEKLVDKAEGCPRQVLILLEQIIYLPKEEQIKAIKVYKNQEQKVIDLCRALLTKEKWKNICKILKGLEEDPESIRRAVLGYINSVALGEDSPWCLILYTCFKDPYFDTGSAGLTFSCYKALSIIRNK